MLGISVRSIRKIGTIARAWDSSMANASQWPWSLYFSHSQRCRAGRFWSHCIFVEFVRSWKDMESQTAKNQGSNEMTVVKSFSRGKSMCQGIEKVLLIPIELIDFVEKWNLFFHLYLQLRKEGKENCQDWERSGPVISPIIYEHKLS